MLLQTVANDTPGFYATSKFFTLGTELLLALVGFYLVRRLFDSRVAVGVWFAPGAAKAPRKFVDEPANWSETSRWFADHLKPGERFAFPYTSLYSTFDQPFPEPDQRLIYLYRLPPGVMLDDMNRVSGRASTPAWSARTVPSTRYSSTQKIPC